MDGARYLILEFVEGPTLAERIPGGRVPTREALEIALQIAEAVEYAHENGVVHVTMTSESEGSSTVVVVRNWEREFAPRS